VSGDPASHLNEFTEKAAPAIIFGSSASSSGAAWRSGSRAGEPDDAIKIASIRATG
jgi:hypothetical protein